MAGRQGSLEGVAMKFWKGRRVFLTGHTGFKGAWLSIWLESLGAKVTGYALKPPTRPNPSTGGGPKTPTKPPPRTPIYLLPTRSKAENSHRCVPGGGTPATLSICSTPEVPLEYGNAVAILTMRADTPYKSVEDVRNAKTAPKCGSTGIASTSRP